MAKARKAKPGTSNKCRAPTELLPDLLALEQRIRPDQRQPGKAVTVSWGDCQRLSHILLQIGRDEDPRAYYWRTLKHRPPKSSQWEEIAALLYLGQVEMGRKPGKALRGGIAKLTGLTDDQVEHAIRERNHGYNAGQQVKIAQAKGTLASMIAAYTQLAMDRKK